MTAFELECRDVLPFCYTILALTLLKQAWPIGFAILCTSPLLLAFSSDRGANDTDPLWHFTLCFLIAAADSGVAHHTAEYFLFSFFFFFCFVRWLVHDIVLYWLIAPLTCCKILCHEVIICAMELHKFKKALFYLIWHKKILFPAFTWVNNGVYWQKKCSFVL